MFIWWTCIVKNAENRHDKMSRRLTGTTWKSYLQYPVCNCPIIWKIQSLATCLPVFHPMLYDFMPYEYSIFSVGTLSTATAGIK